MNFRQIQAILHSWFGIIVLWVIFFIFFTGSIAYFRTEINVWAQPEAISHIQTIPSAQHSAQTAFNYLNQHAPNAKRWRVTVANERMPVNLLQWQDKEGNIKSYKTLIPESYWGLYGRLWVEISFSNYITRFILCQARSVA